MIQRSDILRAGLPACIVASLCLSFFVNKAFTIDDTIFLRAAQQAAITPAHPFAFDACWDGDGQVRRFSQFVANAPLMGYVLIPAVLSQRPELIGHLLQLGLLLAGILLTASIALRLGLSVKDARLAAALTGTCAAVLGMAGTVMPDVLAMTLGLLAFERFLAWRESGSIGNAVAVGLALALGPLARPQLALMLLVCALCGLPGLAWAQIRANWRKLIPGAALATASGLLYLVLAAVTRDPAANAVVLREGLVLFSPLRAFYHSISLAFYLALTTPFAAGTLALLFRDSLWRFTAILAAAVPAVFGVVSGNSAMFAIGLFAVTVICVCWLAARLLKVAEPAAVSLAVWCTIPLAMTLYLHMAAKFTVPSVPAISIVLVMLARNSGPIARRVLWISPVPGIILGLAILSADARAGRLARDAATKWTAHAQSGQKVLFYGQWGFQWYAEAKGASCFDAHSAASAHPGDLVMVDLLGGGSFPRDLYPRSRLVDQISDGAAGGVLLNREHNVGFFSDGFGRLPWYWAPAGTLRFELWRVE